MDNPRKANINLQQAAFKGKAIGLQDIRQLDPNTHTLSLEACTSSNWNGIGLFIAALKNLRIFFARSCSLDDQFCSGLSRSNSIETVQLTDCPITYRGIQQLAMMPQLKQLRLVSPMRNNVVLFPQEAFVATLSKLTRLQILEMVQPTLTRLNISGSLIGDKKVEFITRNLPNLDELQLGSNDITHVGVELLVPQMRLSRLDIKNNRIGSAGAIIIAQKCDRLVRLNISTLAHKAGSNGIGLNGLDVLCRSLTQLEWLDVGMNPVGDAGAIIVAQGLFNLKELRLQGCEMGFQGAKELGRALSKLKMLRLNNNMIGSRGTASIVKGMVLLKGLWLSSNRLGKWGVRWLTLQRRNFEEIQIRDNEATAYQNQGARAPQLLRFY